jgi:hypothetical protein
MLSRSIAAGQAAEQLEQLEIEYNEIIHALMSIHYSITGVNEMQDEIKILQDCFDAIERRFA